MNSEYTCKARLFFPPNTIIFFHVFNVDFFVPGVPKVGGFSICSTPGLLKREGVLELAVKYSKHPPAHWCALDSEVDLRVGGGFYFDLVPSEPAVELLLLVAGRVGINPFYSILLHVADLHPGLGLRTWASTDVLLCKNTQGLLFNFVMEGFLKKKVNCIVCLQHRYVNLPVVPLT
ncbi:oxidoreductase NAD-binding domain-containing protein 1 isoform X1 [Acipenser oxyrinchus oxyrinchus]|uniref:Oxidoreductase NAD-binding domain-containing protein 1 isoform X1 n=1 Tax=Acipenser oxyrinchus oxyrinchus TaxID=40147 RepID=A0AAD8GES1_ACIOX|nr:oxidoreductase NAD-binding domain-containing protein 1 isoform X1 [Acipenser oxyrinchus oxyrinchus]